MLAIVAVASAAATKRSHDLLFTRVGVLAQLAAGSHAGEAVAQVRFPAVQTGRDRRPGVWV
jgi:hypothetical protein